jgi:hypothetical protein
MLSTACGPTGTAVDHDLSPDSRARDQQVEEGANLSATESENAHSAGANDRRAWRASCQNSLMTASVRATVIPRITN